MRFCRYITKDGTRYGLVENVDGRDTITHELPGPQLQVSEAGVPQRVVIPEASQARKLDEPLLLDHAKLLIPMPIVSKILCVWRNYAEHAKELGNEVPAEPLIFSKPPSALLASGGAIVRPPISLRVDFEGELGVVIGRTIRNLHADWDVRDYILGYTCLNDVTARDLQTKDIEKRHPWFRSKSFDTFTPMGPWIVTADTIKTPLRLGVECRVNGKIRQHANTRDLVFYVPTIIEFVTRHISLEPGDVISTGTPEGIGPLKGGDIVSCRVEHVGELKNPVRYR